jgi:integrating conjugative element protein (TIGR03756 family)
MVRRDLALVASLLFYSVPLRAGTITTSTIAVASLSFSCLEWQVIGFCAFLRCGFGGCRINLVPKICHYLPDVVVSVHRRSEQNPWVEMSSLSAAARGVGSSLMGMLIDGGTRSEGDGHREDKGMEMNEVSVIGNPIVGAPRFGLPLCRSQATPFRPSPTHRRRSWRAGLTEVIYRKRSSGLRGIRTWPINTWGSVHPRIGSVVQTRAEGGGRGRPAVWTSSPAHEPAARVPRPSPAIPAGVSSAERRATSLARPLADACTSHAGQLRGRLDQRPAVVLRQVADDGGYAWNYWRKYQCCIGGRGRLLLHVGLLYHRDRV